MALSKTQYILRSLSKISRKKWEYFIVSRVLHKLDDDEIEFKTQQLVRSANGARYMTDLYFPQFGLHLEVDERHHLNNQEADKLRERDIISETSHEIPRITTFDDAGGQLPLDEIRKKTDDFVSEIKRRKAGQQAASAFVPWDYEHRYSSEPVIERGIVDIEDNVTFELQVEALRCFGFKGNGWMKGAWTIPDGSGDWVWFPRLYRHGMWNNELSADGKHIFERAANDEGRKSVTEQIENAEKNPGGKAIVFAKSKDSLGFNLLRYVGTFTPNLAASTDDCLQFDRVATCEKVRPCRGTPRE